MKGTTLGNIINVPWTLHPISARPQGGRKLSGREMPSFLFFNNSHPKYQLLPKM